MNDNNFKKYFMEFKAIQDSQISAFKINNEFDLDTMIFQRNRAFENLRNAISLVSPSLLKKFIYDTNVIIGKDKILIKKLDEQKGEILKKINQSSKGKQLLKGYRITPTNSLRFMNNKI